MSVEASADVNPVGLFGSAGVVTPPCSLSRLWLQRPQWTWRMTPMTTPRISS